MDISCVKSALYTRHSFRQSTLKPLIPSPVVYKLHLNASPLATNHLQHPLLGYQHSALGLYVQSAYILIDIPSRGATTNTYMMYSGVCTCYLYNILSHTSTKDLIMLYRPDRNAVI